MQEVSIVAWLERKDTNLPHQSVVLPLPIQFYKLPWRKQTNATILSHNHVPEVCEVLDGVNSAEPQVLVHIVG